MFRAQHRPNRYITTRSIQPGTSSLSLSQPLALAFQGGVNGTRTRCQTSKATWRSSREETQGLGRKRARSTPFNPCSQWGHRILLLTLGFEYQALLKKNAKVHLVAARNGQKTFAAIEELGGGTGEKAHYLHLGLGAPRAP